MHAFFLSVLNRGFIIAKPKEQINYIKRFFFVNCFLCVSSAKYFIFFKASFSHILRKTPVF